ncbi:MAG: CvpA family protein [Vallitaleaceae bacterium]|nr:CvpA family protein [Vallitaleaceae bacterium]
MSYLDYVFLGILFLCIGIGYSKGLIKTLYGFVSTLIGLFLSYAFYPVVSAFLIKSTGLYKFIMEKVIKTLKLEQLVKGVTSPNDQIQLIQDLKVPHFIKKTLIHENNPVVYDLLKASGLEEYIGGTIATIVINALAFLIVFVIVLLLMRIIALLLHFVSKLPVVHQMDKLGGLAIGIIQGTLIVWVVCTVISFMIAVQGNEKLLLLIERSPVVQLFYNNNLLVEFIGNITKTLIK